MFVDVNNDWCIVCKFNKITALYSIRTVEMFQRRKFVMWGGFTSQDDEIYKLLTYYNMVVITFHTMLCLVLH